MQRLLVDLPATIAPTERDTAEHYGALSVAWKPRNGSADGEKFSGLDAGERLDLAREQVEVGRREVGNRREQSVRVREQRLRDLAVYVRLPSALRGVGVEDGVVWLGGVVLEREPL